MPVDFTRNPGTPVADFIVRVGFNNANLTAASATAVNGGGCSIGGGGTFVTVLPPAGLSDIQTNTYCNIAFTIAPGAPAPSAQALTLSFAPGGNCIDNNANTVACALTNGVINVTGGGTPTGPDIAYNPAAGASAGTGGPVNFTGVTTPGTTGNGSIVATPSGGAAAGTTTVGTFTLSGPDAANFAVTSAATLTFTAGTNTPQNITMTCTSGAAQRTANLQATETITNGATTQRFWQLVCPAGVAAAVPPMLTYAPATGTTTNLASEGVFNVAVGCPTDGAPATCGGSGTGLAATSRLVSVSSAYTGPPFSPTPSMVCEFVSEAGATVAGPRDYVAGQLDAGDVRCTCPATFTAEPFTVTVVEQSPAGGASVNRTFNVVCGAGQTCGTIGATPGTGTVNLNNGGAAVNVATVNFTGASNGVTQQVTCTQSGVSAGSTFTVTGVPATLSNASTSTTIAATCSNTATTTGTATLTCTSTANSPGCTTLNATYTLTCPGVNVPPPVESVPVPAINEQGRILLAALVLLLGLGVIGFRMRG